MKNALVIDCNYICHTILYTLPPLTNDNNNTQITYGFIKRIVSLCEKFKPDNIAFAWDSNNRSIRTEIYPQYKKTRKDKRQAQTPQEKLARRLARIEFEEIKTHTLFDLGFVNVFCVDGYEADDIMASLVANNKNYKFILITTDKDMYQTVSDNCDLYDPIQDRIIDIEFLRDKHNCTPEQWGEARAISGCRTDNVAGVMGVAEKTAIKFLNGLLDRDSIKYKNIIEKKETIEKNRELVILPFPTMRKLSMSDKNELSRKTFVGLCERSNFRSMLNKDFLEKWDMILTENRN